MLSLIVAVDDNFLIGNNNELPWYEPNDLKYFKKVTPGKAVFMGYILIFQLLIDWVSPFLKGKIMF